LAETHIHTDNPLTRFKPFPVVRMTHTIGELLCLSSSFKTPMSDTLGWLSKIKGVLFAVITSPNRTQRGFKTNREPEYYLKLKLKTKQPCGGGVRIPPP
jgi:hypothetical protein